MVLWFFELKTIEDRMPTINYTTKAQRGNGYLEWSSELPPSLDGDTLIQQLKQLAIQMAKTMPLLFYLTTFAR